MSITVNVHIPQRLAGESFTDYKARRRVSNELAAQSRKGADSHGWFAEKTNPKRVARRAAARAQREAINQPKPLDVRVYKPKQAIKPTWPKTKDQRKQSRPVIVCHPLRATARRWLSEAEPDAKGNRSLTTLQRSFLQAGAKAPKWVLDRHAV